MKLFLALLILGCQLTEASRTRGTSWTPATWTPPWNTNWSEGTGGWVTDCWSGMTGWYTDWGWGTTDWGWGTTDWGTTDWGWGTTDWIWGTTSPPYVTDDYVTGEGDYYCHGHGNGHIPWYWVCDGIIDCPYEDDEAGCDATPSTPSTPDDFYCYDGSVIPENWVCDHISDCEYGEDEAGCGGEWETKTPYPWSWYSEYPTYIPDDEHIFYFLHRVAHAIYNYIYYYCYWF